MKNNRFTIGCSFLLTILLLATACKKEKEKALPGVTSITPAQGCVSDLTTISLIGENLQLVATVQLNGTPVDFVIIGQDELQVPASALQGFSVGAYKVSVWTSEGKEVQATANFTINLNCLPRLQAIVPDEAKIGDTIKLEGMYFTEPSLEVYFDATPAPQLASTIENGTTDSTIYVIVPANCMSGPVIVKNSVGASNNDKTFKLVQADPDPPLLTQAIGNSPGSVSRGCLLSLVGQHLAPQGETKVDLLQSGQVVASFGEVAFEPGFNDVGIRIRIPGDVGIGPVTFEVTTDYGSSTIDFAIQDYSLEALDVLPQSNYIGGPFLLNKQGGGNIERIIFSQASAAVQNEFNQEGDYLASRVPVVAAEGYAPIQLESQDGCYSNPLPFDVAPGVSPWGGGIGGNENVVIPNPPPSINFTFMQLGKYGRLAFVTPNSEVYEFEFSETSIYSGDTFNLFTSFILNGTPIPSATGKYKRDGSFLEIDINGKKYSGRMHNDYPPLSFPTGTLETPRHFILYPLHPGEIVELTQPYVIDDIQPSTFSAGDTIKILGKYFDQNLDTNNSILHYFFQTADGNTAYSSFYASLPAVKIWDSATQIRMIIPTGIPSGNYLFSIGKIYRSNGISITLN